MHNVAVYSIALCYHPVARSPLFSHITATLQGLPTIRACERQNASIEYFHAYQDEQTKGWSTYINATRWLGLRVDFISALFITLVMFLAIPLTDSKYFTLNKCVLQKIFIHVKLFTWINRCLRNDIRHIHTDSGAR